MIYVTHDQVEAMTMADKIVVLQNGVIEQVGSPLELYRNPRNLFVAGFIGSPKMNLLQGTKLPRTRRIPSASVPSISRSPTSRDPGKVLSACPSILALTPFPYHLPGLCRAIDGAGKR